MLRSSHTTREDGGRVGEGPAGGHSVSRWQDGIRTPVCPMGPALPPETGLRCHRQRPDLVGRPEGPAPPARPRCPAMAILLSPSLGSRAPPLGDAGSVSLSPRCRPGGSTRGGPGPAVGSLRRCRVVRPGSTHGELTSSPRRPRLRMPAVHVTVPSAAPRERPLPARGAQASPWASFRSGSPVSLPSAPSPWRGSTGVATGSGRAAHLQWKLRLASFSPRKRGPRRGADRSGDPPGGIPGPRRGSAKWQQRWGRPCRRGAKPQTQRRVDLGAGPGSCVGSSERSHGCSEVWFLLL